MATTTAAVAVSIAALSQPLKDLYESGKTRFKEELSKWNNSRQVRSLVTKVAAYEQVKTIWQRDKKVRLSAFYFPSKVNFPASGVTKTINSLRDLPSIGGIVLQGTVGQGKTVFLRYLCIQELTHQSSGRIPVFFELRKLDSSLTLEKALFNTLESLGFEMSDELFEYYAQSGKLVILLDAFDELEESLVNHVITTLEFWATRYPQMQFIVTCRPGGEIQKSNHFSVIHLSPLTADEHKPFLTKIGVKGETLDHLLNAINNSPVEIRGLLTTPLLLTLLVLVYQSEGVVPNELPEFFNLLFATVFARHDRSKPAFNRRHKSGLNERKLERLFEAFCFAVLRRRYTVNLRTEQFDKAFSDALTFSDEKSTLDGFKHDIVKVACLLQEDGLYISFVHKSLLDYFPAAFIKNCTDDQAARLYSSISQYWQQWQHSLQFLSYIDSYRFAKHFAIPHLELLLKTFGVVDSNVTIDNAKFFIETQYPKSTHFNFVFDSSGNKYVQRKFGPYSIVDSFFERAVHTHDLIRHQDFLTIKSLDVKYEKIIEDEEEQFVVCWMDLFTKEQIEEVYGRAEMYLRRFVDELSTYRKLVAEEMRKAELFAALDVSN